MRNPLKIAMMVRSYIPMPRPIDMIYAPIDLAIAIAKGLGRRGHEVTIYAPLGTIVAGENVKVETLTMRPLINGQSDLTDMKANVEVLMHGIPGLWDRYMSNAMFDRAAQGEYDVLHFHHPEVALSTAQWYKDIPVIYTLHDPIYSYYRELFELFRSPNQYFVSISKNQRRDAPDLQYAGTAYNGTDTEFFAFCDEPEDYLLFSGRLTAEKGVREAIHVARESGHRLLIIGPVDYGQKGYFDQYINPELDEKILYLGRIDQDRLIKYYQKAKAMLTPVQWEEPFGLTTIEAMSCGTPVISLSRGAAPEIIKNGRNGYVVNSITDMVDAVGKLDAIKRSECRRHVEQHFSIDKMIDAYENIYYDVCDKQRGPAAPAVVPKKPIKGQLRKLKGVLSS